MPSARNDDQRAFEQPGQHQPWQRTFIGHRRHGQFNAALLQIRRQLFVKTTEQPQLHSRKAAMELWHDQWQQHGRRRGPQADAEAAGLRTARLLRLFLHLEGLAQYQPGARQQALALLGQGCAPHRAAQQQHAQARLQPLQARGQARLRQAKPPGRSAQAAGLDHGHKGLELLQGHDFHH